MIENSSRITLHNNAVTNRVSWSLCNLPCPITGVALSCVGSAVMWLKLATYYNFRSTSFLVVIYTLTLYSVVLIVTYMIRIVYDPKSWFHKDFSTPDKIFRMGIMSNTICMIALISSTEELQFSEIIPLSITAIGMTIQIPSMLWFVYQCTQHSCWPEPFYNAALQSCIFPVISLPGSSPVIMNLRHGLLCTGLLTLIPSSTIQMYRVLIPRKSEKDIVANNPSVCIMQTGWSISLIAWLAYPLTSNAIHSEDVLISQIFFMLSTTLDILTWIAIWQRRKALYSFGFNHPTWAAVSFPFASSAIAANMYNQAIGPSLSYPMRILLTIWVLLLSSMATILLVVINGIFMKNGYFLENTDNMNLNMIYENGQNDENNNNNNEEDDEHDHHSIDGGDNKSRVGNNRPINFLNDNHMRNVELISYARDLVV